MNKEQIGLCVQTARDKLSHALKCLSRPFPNYPQAIASLNVVMLAADALKAHCEEMEDMTCE